MARMRRDQMERLQNGAPMHVIEVEPVCQACRGNVWERHVHYLEIMQEGESALEAHLMREYSRRFPPGGVSFTPAPVRDVMTWARSVVQIWSGLESETGEPVPWWVARRLAAKRQSAPR